MDLHHITYQGPALDDPEILRDVPDSLGSILHVLNGFVQFGGGLHVRGACTAPDWHSLRQAWTGPQSVAALFPAVDPAWVPFAQDCVGDQFLLHDTHVLRLSAETGEIEDMSLTLATFLEHANADPVEFLGLEPLLQFQNDQGALPDGHLLHAYPPFCSEEAAQGVSLAAVPMSELHQFHAELARTFSLGTASIEVRITD